MSLPKVWITSCRHVPSRTDFDILEWLATFNDYVSFRRIFREVPNGCSGIGKNNSVEILKEKGLIEERGERNNRELMITSKGREMLILCQRASRLFGEIEELFEKAGW